MNSPFLFFLQMTTRTKNSYAWLLLGGVSFIIYLIIKALDKKTPKIVADFVNETNIDKLRNIGDSLIRTDKPTAIAAYQRMFELDPENLHASALCGLLLFKKNDELSFQYLEKFHELVMSTQSDLMSVENDYCALYFYVLGYHHMKKGDSLKAETLKKAALDRKAFLKSSLHFIKEHPY